MQTLIFTLICISLISVVSIVHSEFQKEDILEVDYIRDGPRGYLLNLKITPDSIFYDNFGPGYSNAIAGRIYNDHKNWDDLKQAINLSAFDKIKSAMSRSAMDKGDERLDIKTSVRTHAVLLDLNNRQPVEKVLDQVNGVLAKIKGIR